MDIPESTKLLMFIVVYFFFTAFVPDSPSIYNFLVVTVGAMISVTSLVFLELYLNSRPLNQRNLLNGNLHIIVYTHIICTARYWLVSAATSLFHYQLIEAVLSHPLTFINLMVLRPHIIILLTSYCTMSVSKLILVISPAIFQNISAQKGFWVSMFVVIFLSVLDLILIEIKCGYNEKDLHDQFEYKAVLRFELGMNNNTVEQVLKSINSSTEDSKYQYREEYKGCRFFPFIQILCFAIIGLELIRLFVVVILEVRKLLKTKRVNDNQAPVLNQPQRQGNHNITSHNCQPTETNRGVVLTPDNFNSIGGNCSRIINVMPADDSTNSIEETTTTSVCHNTIEMSPSEANNSFATRDRSADCIEVIDETTAEENTFSGKETLAQTEESVPSTSARNENAKPAAANEDHKVQILEPNITAAILKKVSSRPIERTITETIKNTMRLILFRAATLSLVFFLFYIIAYVSVYSTNNGKELFLPRLALSIARLLTIFVPVGYIAFDRDIRVYVFFKVKHMWQRYRNL